MCSTCEQPDAVLFSPLTSPVTILSLNIRDITVRFGVFSVRLYIFAADSSSTPTLVPVTSTNVFKIYPEMAELNEFGLNSFLAGAKSFGTPFGTERVSCEY